ncbi:hypothetical protein BS78_04G122000 [Paspalum vaginatum]|nr:hypothetical protein BS78_04G122000 [Paspalum vaginatum]
MWRQGRRLHSGSDLTMGLGVQWTPPNRKLPAGAEPRPGTLQLCSGNHCLVFQIAQAGAVPNILRRILADGRVTFAAYNVASDCRKLWAHHGLEVRSTLELRRAAAAAGLGNASLADMAERLLGIRGVGKSKRVCTSKWGGRRLSRNQVRHASVDAYLSCLLGVCLRRHDEARQQVYECDYYSDDEAESLEGQLAGEQDYDDYGDWDRCVGYLTRQGSLDA